MGSTNATLANGTEPSCDTEASHADTHAIGAISGRAANCNEDLSQESSVRITRIEQVIKNLAIGMVLRWLVRSVLYPLADSPGANEGVGQRDFEVQAANSLVETDGRTRRVEVRAGHVEIVGDKHAAPTRLIVILQEQGLIGSSTPERRSPFSLLLANVVGLPPRMLNTTIVLLVGTVRSKTTARYSSLDSSTRSRTAKRASPPEWTTLDHQNGQFRSIVVCTMQVAQSGLGITVQEPSR